MIMKLIFITIEECYLIHEKMIEIGGGRGGVRDFTLIYSAIERPKASFGGKDLYPDVLTKGTALIHLASFL